MVDRRCHRCEDQPPAEPQEGREEKRPRHVESQADADVRGILVAPSVTERAEALLAEKGLEFVSLTPQGE